MPTRGLTRDDSIAYETRQAKAGKRAGRSRSNFDPYSVEYTSPFMRNPDYIQAQFNYLNNQSSGAPSASSASGASAGSSGTSGTTGTSGAQGRPTFETGFPGQGQPMPAVNEPVSSWSSGYNRFGEPVPQWGEAAARWITAFPASGVLGILQQFGGTANVTNPYTSFLLQDLAPGAELAWRLGQSIPEPRQFVSWLRQYLSDLTQPLGSVDFGSSPLFGFNEFMSAVRDLVSGNVSNWGSVWEQLQANQDPEQQARTLSSLLRAMSITAMSAPLMDAMERDLQNQLYNYYVYVTSSFDPTNTRGTPTSFIDYLRNTGWFQRWLGRWM
jgi:hypothetical protein